MILDADGLWYLGQFNQKYKQNKEKSNKFNNWIHNNSNKIILTPNIKQFERICDSFMPGKRVLN